MKLAKIELAEFTAAARMFPSRVIKPGDRMSDGAKITGINMDDNGHVWLRWGARVIAMPASSLVYWEPEDGEKEWARRFESTEIAASLLKGVYERTGVSELMGEPPATLACPTCHKPCASAAGLAKHMTVHVPK